MSKKQMNLISARVIEDKDNILSNEKLKKNTKEKMRCSK